MNAPQWITVLALDNGILSIYQRFYFRDLFLEEMRNDLPTNYSANNWLVIPTADLPADFSVDTYTIVDGELVRLPAEVIAERQAAALRASEQAAAAAEIARLKEYLTATDWAVVKCLEIGAPLAEIYPELAAERIEARAHINTLEEQTKTTAQ